VVIIIVNYIGQSCHGLSPYVEVSVCIKKAPRFLMPYLRLVSRNLRSVPAQSATITVLGWKAARPRSGRAAYHAKTAAALLLLLW